MDSTGARSCDSIDAPAQAAPAARTTGDRGGRERGEEGIRVGSDGAKSPTSKQSGSCDGSYRGSPDPDTPAGRQHAVGSTWARCLLRKKSPVYCLCAERGFHHRVGGLGRGQSIRSPDVSPEDFAASGGVTLDEKGVAQNQPRQAAGPAEGSPSTHESSSHGPRRRPRPRRAMAEPGERRGPKATAASGRAR